MIEILAAVLLIAVAGGLASRYQMLRAIDRRAARRRRAERRRQAAPIGGPVSSPLPSATAEPRSAAAATVSALAHPTAPEKPAAATDPLSRIVEGLRRRKGARVGLSVLALGMALVAVGVIGYPFYTNLVQSRIQGQLDRQLASDDLGQDYRDGRVAVGDALTRLKIPALDVDVVVVEGTTSSALRAGAGHYPETPLPCELGNVAIAGHRTTYGRPFHNLDQMKPGDAIILETPVGTCTYEATGDPFIVAPTALSVLDPTPQASLTLTTCHPKGSARQRLILQADMVSAEIEDL